MSSTRRISRGKADSIIVGSMDNSVLCNLSTFRRHRYLIGSLVRVSLHRLHRTLTLKSDIGPRQHESLVRVSLHSGTCLYQTWGIANSSFMLFYGHWQVFWKKRIIGYIRPIHSLSDRITAPGETNPW